MQRFNRINFWGKGFYYLLLLCAFFTIFTKPTSAATGINHTINFQGKLVNSDGTNVSNGSYSIVFSLYTVSSGGTAAWTETDSVTTIDGVFRVALGGSTTFSSATIDFNSDTYYLGIKVGSDAEMTPRVQFTAVPYAFNAEKVNGLTVTNNGGNTLNIAANKTLTANSSLTLGGTDGKSLTVNGSTTLADNVITFGGTETLTLAATKNVSFADAFTTSGANPLTLTTTGTTNATLPSGTITLADLTTAQTFTNKIIGSTGLTFTGATTDITTGTNEDFILKPNGTGKIGLFATGTLGSTFDLRANSGTLSIASIAGTTSFAGLVVDNSSGPLFTASTGGVPKFTIGNNGSITASNYAGANAVLYAAPTTGLFTAATTTTGSQCLTSTSGASGVPTWGSCGGGTNYWQQTTSGSFTYVSPNPITQLVSIGQTTGLTASGLSVKVNSLGNAAGYIENTGTGDIFTASSAGTTKFVIDKNGNVGINTAAPTANLMVAGKSTNQDASILLQASGSTNISKLIFGDSSALRWEFGNSTTDQFYIYDDTNGATRFSISGQSVDIGAGTPLTSTGLHVGVDSKGNATQVVDNLGGLGDLFTASSAGVSKFTIDKSGNVVLGADNTTPGAVTVRGAAASGTDIAGGNLTIDASNGTGAGGSGAIIFRTAAGTSSSNTVTADHTTDYDTGGSNVASKAVSFTVNSQSNNLIILSASINSTTHTISSVSDSVNGSFTQAAGTTNGSVYTSIWYLKGPSTGAHTITITPSASDTIIGSVTQFYNVDQTTPVGTAVTNTGSGTSTSVVVTSTNTTQLVYDTVANPGGGTFSAPLGTQIYNHNAASSSQVAGSTITGSSTSTTLGWTISGTQSWVDIGIPINPTTGGGGSTADTLTDRFHITASGNVGIGTSTPGSLFDIEGSGSFKVDSTGAITTSSVGQGALKTATGSTTSSNASVNITMNDYNFFPSITCSSGNVALQTVNSADPGNTTGRFRAVACGTGNTLTVRWRYITASDHPTIWAIVNADGSVSSSVWEAEDPMEPTKYPENPNPLIDTPLQSGQYYLSPQPASIDELKTLYNSFPQSDRDAVLNDVKQYVVDTRHWLSSFTSLDDISQISDRYQPAAREWAVRLLADHYKVSPALAIHLFFAISNGNLVTVSDPYGNLQAYNAQLAQKQTLPSSQQQADLAEWYQQEQNGNAQAGDVVSVNDAGTLSKTTTPYDEHIAGIVSTSPFQVMGNQQNANDLQLALTGKVPVHVSTKNGEIHAGDYLTSSSDPGVAMKATKAGKVIGQALESYSGTTVGTILVKVENTHFGGVFLSKSGLTTGEDTDIHTLLEAETGIASATESASQIFTDKVIAGLSVVAPKVVTGNLQVDKIQSATGKNISLQVADDGKFIISDASGSAAIQFDAKGNAFFNGTITADKIQANQVEGLDIITNQVAQLSNQVASLSAKLSVLAASTSATDVTIDTHIIASDSAAISGLTVTTDATISGKLRVKGSGLFEGILSVIDTLKANDFMATGIAEFFNTAIFHNDVSFEGQPTFNADTAGFALIKKGSDHIDITFDKPYQATPVVNATLSVTSTSVTPTPVNGKTLEQRLLAEGYYYIVTKQSTKGFTILLNKQASEDVQFSWSALSIKDAKLFQSGELTPTPSVTLTPIPSDFLLNPEATGSAQ